MGGSDPILALNALITLKSDTHMDKYHTFKSTRYPTALLEGIADQFGQIVTLRLP